jgi:hypothetical protein
MPDLKGLVGQVISLINYVIPALITVALVLFLWGLVRFVYNNSDPHAKTHDKEIFIWGFLAMFVLVSVWGIVALLCVSFFGSRSCEANVYSQTPAMPGTRQFDL